MSDTVLELLRSVGVDIPSDEWLVHHPPPPPPARRTEPGMDPQWVDHLGVPYFSSSQVEWCHPDVFGVEDFGVLEDDYTAHPYTLSWDDEQYYRANYRPKHRYSRPYRLRWTLAHVVGGAGKCNPATLHALKCRLAGEKRDVIRTRGSYEWVRRHLAELKQTRFNISIPWIVMWLGGPKWRVSTQQCQRVLEASERMHRAFQAQSHGRRRFPKMQYVLLRALDREGVAPPYHVKWARTSIKRRQLADLLAKLDP